MDDKIQKRAYDVVTEKLKYLHDKDKGAYFHGWFDCIYFMEQILKEKGY